MRTDLFIGRTVILATLTLTSWLLPLSTYAADQSPGSGIPEIMGTQPSAQPEMSSVRPAPAQSTWVDDIRNSLGIYKANYPASDFSPYLAKLDLVRNALGRGDRRAVKVEMGAFFRMLAKRDHGISDVAAEELTNFAQMVTPLEEYGIAVPRSAAGQYGTEVPRSGSAQ